MLAKFVGAVRSGWGDTPVLTVLVRDGIWAYAAIFGAPPSVLRVRGHV